jgi:hypothetical protein
VPGGISITRMSSWPQSTPLVIFSRAFDTYDPAIEIQIKKRTVQVATMQEDLFNKKYSAVCFNKQKLKL